jgi:hypothetical protein
MLQALVNAGQLMRLPAAIIMPKDASELKVREPGLTAPR